MRLRIAVFAVVTLLAVVASTLISVLRMEGPASAEQIPNGLQAASAAPSCLAIKQNFPSSESGTYWLLTSTLAVPRRFYCDMTTDGGGWVLVGRGREGWTFHSQGQGTPSDLVEQPDGIEAFTPVALSSDTINGLLDGGSVKDLADGVRLRRAADPDGLSWQEFRWRFADLTAWSWAFGGGMRLDETTIDGKVFKGGNTSDSMDASVEDRPNDLLGVDDERRIFTYPWKPHQSKMGFAMGVVEGGSNAPSSYWWTLADEGHPVAFTQVWLRPRVERVAKGPIPAEGLAAESAIPVLSTTSDALPVGVAGVDHTREQFTEAWNVPVLALRQVGDSMFVGGRFTDIVTPDSVAEPQRFLAKLDIGSGAWDPTFRPVIDGRVWDIEPVGDDRLLIAGDFTTVNGQSGMAGLAMLFADTGATDPSFSGSVTRDGDPLPAAVRDIDIADGWVYAVGNFTGVRGSAGAEASPGAETVFTAQRAARFALDTGAPDRRWSPELSATGMAIDVAGDGTRAYIGGTFDAVNADSRFGSFAIVDTETGALMDGAAPFLPVDTGDKPLTQRQDVLEVGTNVVIGGSQHDIQMYQRDAMQLLRSHITRIGGDLQALATVGGLVYASCHCANYLIADATSYPDPSGFSRIDPISLIGAFTPGDLSYVQIWQPTLSTKGGDGPWALTGDSNGCLWAGGDLSGSGKNWLGNVARFCPIDTSPPEAPNSLTGTVAATRVELSFVAPAEPDLRFWVYRRDRVIAVTTKPEFTDRPGPGKHTYWVRAVDPAGNRSATPKSVTVEVGA